MSTADESQIHTIGTWNQHGCNMTNSNLSGASSKCFGIAGTFDTFCGQTSFSIVTELVCNNWTRGATIGKPVTDSFSICRFFFHGLLFFSSQGDWLIDIRGVPFDWTRLFCSLFCGFRIRFRLFGCCFGFSGLFSGRLSIVCRSSIFSSSLLTTSCCQHQHSC